jgi:hypothetical protein
MSGESLGVEPLASVPCGVLAGAVVPDTFERGSGQQSGGTMRARPLLSRGNEPFLDPVGKEIAQSGDLGSGFLGDEDGSIAPLDQGAAPTVESAGFFGEISVEIAHEGGQLIGIVRADE